MLGLVSPFAATITEPCKHTQDSPFDSRIDCVCSYVFIALEKCLSSFSHIFPFLYFSFYSSPVCCLLIISYHTNKFNEHFVLLI